MPSLFPKDIQKETRIFNLNIYNVICITYYFKLSNGKIGSNIKRNEPSSVKQLWLGLPETTLGLLQLWRNGQRFLHSALDIFASVVFRCHAISSKLDAIFRIQLETFLNFCRPSILAEPVNDITLYTAQGKAQRFLSLY